ncbi:MAG: ABC-2 transporter permease [Erysipelotrichaceae bacterium]
MKGLLIKDFLNIKAFGKTLLFVTLFILIINCTNKNSGGFQLAYPIFFSSFLMISSFSIDERAHFEAFAIALPIKRNKIVLSKYLASFVLSLIGAVIGYFFMMISSVIFHVQILGGKELFATIATLLVIVNILSAVSFPIIFKLGIEKARFAFMIIFLLPMIFVLIPMEYLVFLEDDLIFIMKHIEVFGSLALILVELISYQISVKFYRNRDF